MSQDEPIILSSDDEDNGSGLRVSEHRYIPSTDAESKYDSSMGTKILKRSRQHRDQYHGKKYRGWFFTWNNPKHADDKQLILSKVPSKFKYVKFQYEKGEEGTLHYQGFLWSQESCTASSIHKLFRGISLQKAESIKGSINYCGKNDTRVEGPWEKGTKPAQGRRTDILAAKASIDAGKSISELFDMHPEVCIKYTHGIKTAAALHSFKRERDWLTKCFIYYGPPGTGKSQAADIEAKAYGGGTYYLNIEGGTGGKVWWDGYNGEENVIIDEFQGNMKLADFKKLIDRYPYKVPVKGGYVNMVAKQIWFLSNHAPHEWYTRAAPVATASRMAFKRRCHYEEYMDVKFNGLSDIEEYRDFRKQFVACVQEGLYNDRFN